MREFCLPEGFFDKDPQQISAARLTHFKMKVMFHTDELVRDAAKKNNDIRPDLGQQEAEENEMIDKASSASELIDLLRKVKGLFSTNRLYRVIAEKQNETAPLLLDKYVRSYNDFFIESAVIILGNCDKRFTQDLWDRYKEIKSPYAQSEACIVIGEHFKKDAGEFLYKEYNNFKNFYPSESFKEAPYFILGLIYNN